MAQSMLTQLLKELKTLSTEDRQLLADVLTNRPASEKADTRSPQLPCDHGHVWSDERRDHVGKKVRRSCVHCGVLALHTGELHGELHPDEREDAKSEPEPVSESADAADAADAEPSEMPVSPPAVRPSRSKKKAA